MSNGIDLALLGIKPEELQDRVIERICEKVLSGISYDEDGEVAEVDSSFKRKLDARITQHIDGAIVALAEKHVLPGITQTLENLCLQETNRWGEKVGKQVTFIEYLTQRAEAYLQEEVNHEGKTKGQDSYSWSKHSTRVVYLVRNHLQYSINTALEAAMKSANSQIAGGIEKAITTGMNDVLAKIKVTTSTGR